MFHRILSSPEEERIEKERRERLAEFASIINGEDRRLNVSPVLPMNRYKYGFGNRSVKAASSLPKRIVLNPERQEKARKLAELYRLVKGE